jgi:hypothetical protein
MEKRIFIAFGGKAKLFATKWSYLKWAVSTQDGSKYLMMRLLFWPIFRSLRAKMNAHRVDGMEWKQELLENNCPVVVKTEDGIPVRCMYYMADGKTCARHGDVSGVQRP